LGLYLSRSTPLRKTLTVDHYLRIDYFQQRLEVNERVIRYEAEDIAKNNTREQIKYRDRISEIKHIQKLRAASK